jgi:hypothetical protein
MEIIEKYKPIIYFHSDEEYFPDSFEAYLENATLWNKDVKLLAKCTRNHFKREMTTKICGEGLFITYEIK